MSERRVCIIGGAQVILPFRAGGVALRPAEDADGVARELAGAAAEPSGSLVLITEDAAALAPEAVREFEEDEERALMIVPTRVREKSMALERMRWLIVRSVGVDLIAKSPGEAITEEVKIEENEG